MNILLNPKTYTPSLPDARSNEVMTKTIAFFEAKGKDRLEADYYDRVWYADFLEFVKKERIFATIATPTGEGAADARWDTHRICAFAEILGFYGLQYWYTYQVSALGLGALWMSKNEAMRKKTAALLEDGAIFAFGLSEKEHGADIYASSVTLTPNAEGGYTASGSKYYIGNGNKAAIVSTFGKMAGTGEYVFFAVDSQHPRYTCVKNVVASQSYVSEFTLDDYPITEGDILSRGQEAWDSALNTINICKFNLGWASIGICTHAFYEAINHASKRRLYNMMVTDFPHVKQMFVDAYARLVAMKLFAMRAADYMRAATADDRRYLLYNPMVKMKVTTQGEDVINLLWDVIAAKGFERDTYFAQAAVDIRGLPKLEGTVHVNIALIVKFMPSYFFFPADLPAVGPQHEPKNDDFLFHQGTTRGLSKIRFHDYKLAFAGVEQPNVSLFLEQAEAFKAMLATTPPSEAQQKDLDFLLAGGEIFALVVYAQLILENAKILDIPGDLIDQIFDVFVRDFSRLALGLYSKTSSTPEQMAACLGMVRKPVAGPARYENIWKNHVYALAGAYEMNR
ncbi:MAG: acyl-CoA dehydrogenase [Byssovorax sp.]